MYEDAIKNVVKIIDGDTSDAEIDLGFSLTKKERIRLAGIDTPETRTKNLEEKKYGIEARNYLISKLATCKNIIVKTEKDGKYGRMLGWLFDDENKSINLSMIELGFAWEYGGAPKEKNTDTMTLALNELKEKRK